MSEPPAPASALAAEGGEAKPTVVAATPPPAIVFEDLHMVFAVKRKAPVHALRGFSLEVGTGAVLGLLGPNGAGKTTAISCLVGLLRPQRGRVRLHGRELPWHRRQHPEVAHGVLLEDTRLPPFVSVREALRPTCRVRAIRAARTGAEIDRVAALCRAGDLLDRQVGTLSKGQARRAGLAAALVGAPPLLVLDEPSSGLDVTARLELDALVRSLADGRRTMLIASHLLGDLEATCTDLAFVRDGRVVARGPTAALLREARAVMQASDIYVARPSAAASPSKRPGGRWRTCSTTRSTRSGPPSSTSPRPSLPCSPRVRKNGTLQYLLAVPLSRARIATAKAAALWLFLSLAGLLIHGLSCLTAAAVGALTLPLVLWGWCSLLAPTLVAASLGLVFSLREALPAGRASDGPPCAARSAATQGEFLPPPILLRRQNRGDDFLAVRAPAA